MLKLRLFLCGLFLARPSSFVGGSAGGESYYYQSPHKIRNGGYTEGIVRASPAGGGWGGQSGQPSHFPDPAYLIPSILNNPLAKTSLEERLRRGKRKPPPKVNRGGGVGGMCDGKGNLVQDVGLVAIVLGGVGTLLGIFSASFLSVVGNTVSIISAVLSFATGIPSAILTYLAASDRLSYAVANALSVLSIANTFYGIWSVDFGNQDIFLSQFANVIGVFSLLLSIATGFPDIFDEVLKVGEYGLGPAFTRFVRGYGCHKATGYTKVQQAIKEFITLAA